MSLRTVKSKDNNSVSSNFPFSLLNLFIITGRQLCLRRCFIVLQIKQFKDIETVGNWRRR